MAIGLYVWLPKVNCNIASKGSFTMATNVALNIASNKASNIASNVASMMASNVAWEHFCCNTSL